MIDSKQRASCWPRATPAMVSFCSCFIRLLFTVRYRTEGGAVRQRARHADSKDYGSWVQISTVQLNFLLSRRKIPTTLRLNSCCSLFTFLVKTRSVIACLIYSFCFCLWMQSVFFSLCGSIVFIYIRRFLQTTETRIFSECF